MKIYLDFEQLKKVCFNLADTISREYKPDAIVAVARGGMVPATIIAKVLRLPVSVFFPQNNEMYLVHAHAKKMIFIEDLIAEGRTYRQIETFMKSYNDGFAKKTEWEFCPILVDSKSNITPKYFGFKSADWIVMPWENVDSMEENDRGLFREGTDCYGK